MDTSVKSVDITMTPLGSVKIANQIADRSSMEVPIRALAATIIYKCQDVPTHGPRLIAEWVRANILYTHESVGKELLQGPMGTLPWWLTVPHDPVQTLGGQHNLGKVHQFQGAGTGDCDDLSILWAALCRSIGCEAYVVGLGQNGAQGFFHAIGLCQGRFYELSLDHTYGNNKRPVIIGSFPSNTHCVWFDPMTDSYYRVSSGQNMATRAAKFAPAMMGDGQTATTGRRRVSPDDVRAAGDLMLAGMSEAGLAFDAGLFGDSSAGAAIGAIAADVGTTASLTASILSTGIGGGAAAAAGGAAAAGSAAASAAAAGGSAATATAAAAGSAAVPIVGWIIAGCILAGLVTMRVGKTAKYQNRSVDYHNRYVALRNVVLDISGIPHELRPLLALRLDEVIPHACGSYNLKGGGSRIVRQAQLFDVTPPRPFTWSTGSSSRWAGVHEVFRGKGDPNVKRSQVMHAHRNSMEQLARSLAVVNMRERKLALSMLFQQFLGPKSIEAFRGWLPTDLPPPPMFDTSSPPAPTKYVLPIAAVAIGGLALLKATQ
jgi:hypothetical protein